MQHLYAVIAAGGLGTRLWPLSRRSLPKQLIDFGGGNMLDVTVRRLSRRIDVERIVVVTSVEHTAAIRAAVPRLPPKNVIVEPARRGTGPALVLAASHIAQLDAHATMLATPADHLILDEQPYLDAIDKAVDAAQRTDCLVALGLEPYEAGTAYGWIRCGQPVTEDPAVMYVRRFVEKPDAESAQRFFNEGDWLLNCGMYAWRISTFIDALKKHAPALASGLSILSSADDDQALRVFSQLPVISIDHALMEKVDRAVVVRGEFARIDVGDPSALAHFGKADADGNAIRGRCLTMRSGRNVVHNSSDRLITLLGVDDVIVIATNDALLVCAADRAQDVKALVERLETAGKGRFT